MTQEKTTAAERPHARRGRRLARLVTHLLSPGGVAAGVFVTIPILEGEGSIAGAVAVGLFVAVPAVLMLVMKARSAIDDVYDPGPHLRGRFLMFGTLTYLVGYIILTLIDATPMMRWGAASFLGGSSLVWLISRHWKISIHAAGVGGGTVILLVTGGSGLWPVAIAPVAVGWARLQLGAHTLWQLVAGIALGAAVSGSLLFAYRG